MRHECSVLIFGQSTVTVKLSTKGSWYKIASRVSPERRDIRPAIVQDVLVRRDMPPKMEMALAKTSMENLAFALSLALAHNGRFVVHTDDEAVVAAGLVRWAQRLDYDVLQVDVAGDCDAHALCESRANEGHLPELIVWKGLANTTHDTQLRLVRILDQLDNYNTNQNRLYPSKECTIEGVKLTKPKVTAIVGTIQINSKRVPKIHHRLRHKFWFSQFVQCPDQSKFFSEIDALAVPESHVEYILEVRDAVAKVHQSSDITSYIYSLITFIRNHRMVTLAPTQVRLPTEVIDKVSLLAKTIVALRNLGRKDRYFVTPEYCKIAVRSICYWLVNWEIEGGLFDLSDPQSVDDPDLEKRRQLVINMLTAEWYGSEWEYVREYIREHQSHFDVSSNTGFSNSVVEESIRLVRPPI